MKTHNYDRANLTTYMITCSFLLIIFTTATTTAIAQKDASPAMVLLQPAGTSTMVALVFPSKEDHRRVLRVVNDFAAGNQVQTNDVVIKDQQLNGEDGLVIQTEASFSIFQQVDVSSGAFNLQPMLKSLKELKRFDLVYYMGSIKEFRGLKAYQDKNVNIQLIRSGGPYRYRFSIDNPLLPMPILPAFQMDAASGIITNAVPRTTRTLYTQLVVVILLSCGIGLTIWVALQYVSRRRRVALSAAKAQKINRIAPPQK